ncbi:hypothetical protein [Iodobacter fluviatilis]|uniref:Uncharacterized protein n=1 Tax=Iodobacter fluviatilis TaxID=537 RepID=A0A377Q9N7_9NEIS|nr:hypothetical protein [Iodobacter fluviatilis]TCU88489.1 hypothetical protein EV682_10372 [Iodobacter fluviatilis]STQ91440.1 Uncharacterised protein [Iodobacter fluviatilis]
MQNTWVKTNNVAQYQEANWANWIGTKACGSVEAAQAYAAQNAEISFFFYCRQNMVLTNGRSFSPGDAAFFSGQPWYGSAPQCDSYQKVVFNTPAFINDFPVNSAQNDAVCLQWNTNISGFTAQAIMGDPWNLLYASNQTSYFDTNFTTIPSTATAALIHWTAFPNRLSQYLGKGAYPANPYNYSAKQLFAIADQFGTTEVPVPAFQNIPTQLCPQATWNSELHMYGPYGPRGWQDEYCEWSVVRDPQSNKITRIDMTCENPEYWNTLWMIDPQKVADVYSSTLSFGAPASAQVVVPVSDLYLLDPVTKAVVTDPSTGRPAYNPLNKWNSGPVAVRGSGSNYGGAMHLTSTPNTLQTEMALAGGATIQRACGNSVPQTLICCAQYGQAYRNSDPHIGQSVNQAIGGQLTGFPCKAALANPTGLYIQVPDLSGFTLPADPKLPAGASAQDCWQIVRGSAELTDPVTGMLFGATAASPQNGGNFVLHAVFQLPQSWVDAGVSFTIGDITDAAGEPIQWGGQVTQQMSIGLWARPIQVSAAPANEACVLPPPTGVTPPANPVPPDYAQPLQLFHSAIWNAYFNTEVSNPMNTPISLASNSTLIAPIVRLGQSNIPMVLTCTTTQLGPQGQLPTVDFGPDITVVVSNFNDNVNYAVPGNSYPSQCASLNLKVSVGANAELGLRGLTLTNYGDEVQAPMSALLNIIPA